MLFDENGALQRAPCCFPLRGAISKVTLCTLLLLDTDQHLGKEVALQLLPRLSILPDANCPVQT